MEEVGLERDSLPAKKNLMEIPKELFDHIFSNLKLNDLLRLRRVSKQMKPLAEDFLRLHVNSEKFFFLNLSDDEDEALSALLAFDFVAPFSKFSIGAMKDDMWRKWRIQEFLEIYGTRITHLEIDSIEIPIVSRKSIRFLESLPNLKHLELVYVSERKKKGNRASKASKKLVQLIPSSFKRLRTLIIGHYEGGGSLESAGLIWKFVEECSPQLEKLGHPDINCGFDMDLGDLPGGRYGCVRRILEGPHHLKFYEVGICDDYDPRSVQDFYDLVTACAKHNVKLLEVDTQLIEGMMKLETRDKEEHGGKLSSVVVSLCDLQSPTFHLELPLLEKIRVEISAVIFMPRPAGFQRKAWPSLKHLEIWIDSYHLDRYNGEDDSDIGTRDFLDYFFVEITRPKMEYLRLDSDNINPIPPLPRMIDVSTSCPNLKELEFVGRSATSQEISELWTNLPLLEKVAFEWCDNLGDLAFIGNDKENPMFLRAENLRSLTIAGLGDMREITDRLFTQVLRHKPLRELHLQSSNAISRGRITIAGISSLLDGVFSETIERLGLKMKLKGVAAYKLKALGKKFRSSKML